MFHNVVINSSNIIEIFFLFFSKIPQAFSTFNNHTSFCELQYKELISTREDLISPIHSQYHLSNLPLKSFFRSAKLGTIQDPSSKIRDLVSSPTCRPNSTRMIRPINFTRPVRVEKIQFSGCPDWRGWAWRSSSVLRANSPLPRSRPGSS